MPIKLTISHDENNKESVFRKKPIIFGALVVSVLLTVVFLQRNQDIRQRAAPTIGDINGDSNVDLLDYNIFISCYGKKVTRLLCTHKADVDLNKDGTIGGVDYNLLLRGMFSEQHAPVGKATPTPVNLIGDKIKDAVQAIQNEFRLLNLGSSDNTNSVNEDLKSLENQ